jgi:hypothetical protein
MYAIQKKIIEIYFLLCGEHFGGVYRLKENASLSQNGQKLQSATPKEVAL